MAASKDQLPATIHEAGITADQRAPNVVLALTADLGDEAAWRYVEFLIANIRNPDTPRLCSGLQPVLRLVRGPRPDANGDPAA